MRAQIKERIATVVSMEGHEKHAVLINLLKQTFSVMCPMMNRD